jgi:hypothetical protein
MKWLHLAGNALMALALAAPLQAQDKGKKKGDPAGDVPTVDAETLKPGQVVGKVLTVSETSLQVRADIVHFELDPKALAKVNASNNQIILQLVRDQQALTKAYQKIGAAKNPKQQQQAVNSFQQQSARMQQQLALKSVQQQLQLYASTNGGADLLKAIHDYKDVNIELDAKVEYRTMFLPEVFDDMGNVKKYTDAEKKELKGDSKLPGYKATASDVKVGQKVSVTLAKSKEAENKIRGTVVVITEETTETTSPGDSKNPKKKKKDNN